MRMMMLMITMLLAVPAYAAPEIKMSMTAEKEILVLEQGKEVKKRVPAVDVVPTDVIFFTLVYDNKGDEAATSVLLDNPIVHGMRYVNGSAWGAGSDILFSIDGGKTYKKPSLLTYTIKGKQQQASPEYYTNIRWTVKKIAAGKSGSVGFKAVVH